MNPIPTWRETLGNSPHVVAAGAVGQAMQAEIDALRERVKELEAVLREAVRALKYHSDQTRPIERTFDTMDKIKDVLRNPQKVDTSEPTCIDIGGHPV